MPEFEHTSTHVYIVNVEFKNHVALENPVHWTPLIGNAAVPPAPDTFKWRIQKLMNGNYAINHAVYSNCSARVESPAKAGSVVQTRPNQDLFEWTIQETRVKGEYTICVSGENLCWYLPGRKLRTSVELSQNPNIPRARWKFLPALAPASNPSRVPIPVVPPPTAPSAQPTLPGARLPAVIAIKDRAGTYLRVVGSIGLAFSSVQDRFALFAVRQLPVDGNVALIGLQNGKHLNLIGLTDVMCNGKGPEQALSLGVEYREGGELAFGISGHRGQNGQRHFLSRNGGNPSYSGGALAVMQAEDESCRFGIEPVSLTGKVEGVIMIVDRKGHHLSVDCDSNISFELVPGDHSRMIVQTHGRKIRLIGNNGRHFALHKTKKGAAYIDCSADGPGNGVILDVEMPGGSKIYLMVSDQGSNEDESYFLTCRESVGGYGTLELTDFRDADTAFTFVNV